MKRLLLILLCLPVIAFAQTTLIPDANFESYLEANGMGDGILNNGQVTTANIDFVNTLYISNNNISDLTGIQDFLALEELRCNNNQLTTLDVSTNANLDILECRHNQLSSLQVNNDIILIFCDDNMLTSLDLSQCLYLEQLRSEYNQLTSLDLSQNIGLKDELYLCHNQLTSLNLKNGSNEWIVDNQFCTSDNPDLTCIEVDDPMYSTANWTTQIDPQHYFATSCASSSFDNVSALDKKIIKIIDILGKETTKNYSNLQYFIYEDGTVEKKIILEQ